MKNKKLNFKSLNPITLIGLILLTIIFLVALWFFIKFSIQGFKAFVEWFFVMFINIGIN